MPNRLASETSPYLQQHMDNPVDWYPWGEEALAKARAEDKALLVSIGYSSCHWCHVMAHESFEDEETAALMNDRFVNVKVDREERPDLDSVYMTAVQAMSGHGGWPLNVFLTPEGVPFYGGTYWPPEPRQGMPGFRQVLDAVSDAYQNRRAGVNESAAKIREYLERATRARPQEGELDAGILDAAFHELSRGFDADYGGFGGAPKFPQPAVLEFLLRYAKRTGDERASAMVRTTLDQMAEGGIYDQVGGGFARYSVDATWLVPHFEKMLYDNAQLARVYLDAYRADGNPRDARIAGETLDYVVREMTGPDGGFYSSQDADSEGVEGKFYVWTPAEINAALPPREATLVRAYYGVTKRGNFEGKNILHVAMPLATAAAKAGIPDGDARAALDDARAKLLAAREQRVHPGRDEKVLTSWNGLMLRAFAEASRVLGRGDYREVAVRNADFLLTHLRQGDRLLHTYRNGQAKIPGFLEDYAYLADGLLALYEATFERRWIEATLALTETLIAGFADPDGPGFFDTARDQATPVGRPRELQDGATPSGNSVAAGLLLKLAAMTGDGAFQERAAAILRMMARPMREQAFGCGQYLCDLDFYLAMPKEVAIAGRPGDPAVTALADVVYRRFEPHVVLGLADPDDPTLADLLPFLAHRPPRGDIATAYVCEHFACLPPVSDPEDLAIELEQGTGIEWQEL